MEILFRKLSGITFPIKVQPTSSVLSAKQKIMQRSGIQIIEQTLIYKGSIILEDHQNFQNYGIQEKQVVHIIVKKVKKNNQYVSPKKIFIQTLTEKQYQLIVKSTDSIRIIKEKVQNKIGIPPKNQILRYEGKILQNDLCLQDYKISNEEILKLVQKF